MSCVFDRVQITPLVTALRLHGPASERTLPARLGQAAQRGVRIGGQYPHHAVQIAVVERESGTLQAFVIGENLFRAGHVARSAFQFNGIRSQIDFDVEVVFQEADIFVPRAKECFDVGADPDAFLHACAFSGVYPGVGPRAASQPLQVADTEHNHTCST